MFLNCIHFKTRAESMHELLFDAMSTMTMMTECCQLHHRVKVLEDWRP